MNIDNATNGILLFYIAGGVVMILIVLAYLVSQKKS